MAVFLRIVAQLGAKAARWAWANQGTVLRWIARGSSVSWIIQKINDMVS